MPFYVNLNPTELVGLLHNGQHLDLFEKYNKTIALLKSRFDERYETSGEGAMRYCQGIATFLNALNTVDAIDGRETLKSAMLLIPLVIDLRCKHKTGEISFFEVLSYGFSSDEVLQVIDDFYSLSGWIPHRDHSKILYNMVNFADVSLLDVNSENEKVSQLMAKRLNSLNIYIKGLEQLRREWQLTPVGSNTHNGNKQTLFLSKPNAPEYAGVYKPRSFEADDAAARSIAYLNTLMNKGAKDTPLLLPVPPFGCKEGIQKWMKRVTEMTAAQAQRYYTQVGALIFLTHLIGLTNIQPDSLIATADGPIVADAECAFNPWVMLDDTLFSTGMLDSLAANAPFLVDGEASCPWNYSEQIFAGYQRALESCITECLQFTESFVQTLDDLRGSVREIRMTPIPRRMLAQLFLRDETGADLTDCEEFFAIMRVLGVRCGENLDRDLLVKLLKSGFDDGDMPYFTLHYGAAPVVCGKLCGVEIRCNGKTFARTSICPPHFVFSLNFLEVEGKAQLSASLSGHTVKNSE